MATTLPIEIFRLLEDKIGSEEAVKVSSAIEISLNTIDNKAKDIAIQKKLELRDELTKELATKADLQLVETRLRSEIQEVRSEIKVYHAQTRLYLVVLICVMIITNPKALELIAKIFGIVK